jgi:hypothetical protein
LDQFRLKRSGAFLAYNSAKIALSESDDIKYLSVLATNPRAEAIARRYGMRETDYFGFLEQRTEHIFSDNLGPGVREKFFKRLWPKPRRKTVGSESGAADRHLSVPDNYGEINSEWRQMEVSLEGIIPGSDDTMFRKIYTREIAASSRAPRTSEYYIIEDELIYRVRWDQADDAWRVINPLDPKEAQPAVALKLDATGHWAAKIRADETAKALPDRFKATRDIKGLDIKQVNNLRHDLIGAQYSAIRKLDEAIFYINSPEYKDVADQVMEVFYGGFSEVKRKQTLDQLEKALEYLKNIEISKHMLFRIGYHKDDMQALFQTQAGSGTEPSIILSYDALADATIRLHLSKVGFKDYLASELIEGACRATDVETHDHAVARPDPGGLDISDIVALAEPSLKGENVGAISADTGLTREQIKSRRGSAETNVSRNPANTAYAVNVFDDYYFAPARYWQFMLAFNTWKNKKRKLCYGHSRAKKRKRNSNSRTPRLAD